jgi:TolB protein
LYRLTLGAAAVQNLTNNRAQDGSPVYSPDGALILFDSNRDGDYELYLLDPATSGVTRVTNNVINDTSPDWKP